MRVNGAEDDWPVGVIESELASARAVASSGSGGGGGGGGEDDDERLGGVASSRRVPPKTESGSTAQTGMPFDYICPLYGRRDRPPPPSSDLPSISNTVGVHCSSATAPFSPPLSIALGPPTCRTGRVGRLSLGHSEPTRALVRRLPWTAWANRFRGVRYTVGVGIGTTAPPALLLGSAEQHLLHFR